QLTGLLGLAFSGIAALVVHRVQDIDRRSTRVLTILVLCLMLTLWNIHSTENSLIMRLGLPLFNQILSWMLCGVVMLLPLMGSCQGLPRLLSLVIALFIPFLLLSASHEPLFLLALTLHLLCWLLLETYLAPQACSVPEITFDVHDCKIKDITRNIASLNSFDPTWVRCFVTVFSPFLMTTLILWKTVIPFFLVTCVFRAQNVMLQVPADQLFLLMLIQCDLVGVHFLHLVTNQGSWLDIGTSISHFVIVQATTLFLLLLYGMARLCTGAQIFPASSVHWTNVETHKSLESGSVPTSVPTNCLLDVRFALANEQSVPRKRHFE
ncbi:Putative glycosylphosphatidylinositol anchor synthesis protein, partial [Gryllus bimaculatus]